MNLSKEKITIMADDFLKKTKHYREIWESKQQENYEVSCIFLKGNIEHPHDIFVYAEYGDDFIAFNPLMTIEEVLSSYSFHFDSEVFRLLEKDYWILSMTDECHYNIWVMLGEYEEEKVIYKYGFKRYVEYCKRNDITKKYLQEKTFYDGIDITDLYCQKVKSMVNTKKDMEVKL